MAWLQLILDSSREDAEILSELLELFGAVSVSLSAISNEPLFDQDTTHAESLWEMTRVTALLHEDTDLDTLLVTLNKRAGVNHILNHHIELLPDKDWVNEYRQTHGVKMIFDQLCICPTWCTPPENIANVLILDPGLAFGTGAHDTTSLCLEWLAVNQVKDKTVFDYGCGSGILALSALKLGAKTAFAIDIDPQSLSATRSNAEKNALTDQISIGLPGDFTTDAVDILIANILLNPLREHAQEFADMVKPGGNIVLSGILAVQVEDCLAAYQSWFNMKPPVFRQEWVLLEGIRK